MRREFISENTRAQPLELASKASGVLHVHLAGALAIRIFGAQGPGASSRLAEYRFTLFIGVGPVIKHARASFPRIRILVALTSVEEVGPLGTDRQVQAVLDCVQVHKVPKNVPFERLNECRATAFQTLEQVRPAESHEALACSGQVLHLPRLRRSEWYRRRIRNVLTKPVTRQSQRVNRVHDAIRVEPCVG